MNWFFFALVTMLAWGGADLFYKKGADENERFSHLKTSVTVGIVMGIHALYTILFKDIGYDPVNLLRYLPVSAMYILSMTVGYFGLRYLELSISSPVQNSSGAVVFVLCIVFLKEKPELLPAAAVTVICAGTLLLGICESRTERSLRPEEGQTIRGFKAFLIPVLYCVIDALGTFFDAWYLDDIETTPLRNVTERTLEDVANTSYELTFLLCAVVLFLFFRFGKKEKTGFFPVTVSSGRLRLHRAAASRTVAAVLETAGQLTYVYAMSGKAVIAAPMVASYCLVSMLLSRLILKEKLSAVQLLALALIIIGILVLGIFDI